MLHVFHVEPTADAFVPRMQVGPINDVPRETSASWRRFGCER